MENTNFRIVHQSATKPLYIEKCEDIYDNTVYRRRYRANTYVFYHRNTRCYFTLEYVGEAKFSYDLLLSFIIDNRPLLGRNLN